MKHTIIVRNRYVDSQGLLNVEVELIIANSSEIYIGKCYGASDCLIDIMEQICYKHSKITFDFEPLIQELK